MRAVQSTTTTMSLITGDFDDNELEPSRMNINKIIISALEHWREGTNLVKHLTRVVLFRQAEFGGRRRGKV